MRPPPAYDAIILGAGAAGLFCAGLAGQRGRRVLLVDHRDAPGAKILISGGGRCNFTNLHAAPDRFVSANPHFARSALARYTPADFLALVGRHRIGWHEKTLGQLFCDGPARQIVDLLLAECPASVATAFGRPITGVDHGDGVFRVSLAGAVAAAPALVIATGGPSIPKLGATGLAYDLARRFGLKVVEPRPALVPLTLGSAEGGAEQALFRTLAGVAAPVTARAEAGPAFAEAALFTHRGLSGPAILQASTYWRHGQAVTIDFLPGRAPGWLPRAKAAAPRATLRRVLGEALPDRLAETLAERLAFAGGLGGIADARLADAERALAAWRFMPGGSEGFAKAEVTVGGIATADLSSRTMAARRVPGLYAIGEAVDVTGWLGGYNFHWAWASAAACAAAL